MKIRTYPLLIAVVLIISILVIGLRGTVPRIGTSQTDGLQSAKSVEDVSFGRVLWSDNFTDDSNWQLSGPDTIERALNLNHFLDLNVTFSTQQDPQSVVVSRHVNFTFDQNPVVVVQMSVSVGVHYGVRFSGVTPKGIAFDAWRETSELQHRSGLGSVENVSANLALETYLASGHLPVPGSEISQIWFYIEAAPGTTGKFSMRVASLGAISLNTTVSRMSNSSGNLEGVVINLALPSLGLSLFQAYVGFDIRGTPDLQYIPYLVNGTSVIGQGFSYVQNKLTSYEVAVLLPNLVSAFPPFLPDSNSTSIIVAATGGEITYFKLESLSFKFTSTPLLADGFIDPKIALLMIGYYLLFLFVTPIAAVALLSRAFKTES